MVDGLVKVLDKMRNQQHSYSAKGAILKDQSDLEFARMSATRDCADALQDEIDRLKKEAAHG